MMKLKAFALTGIAAALIAPQISAQTIYDNASNYLDTFTGIAGNQQIGDQVIFAPGTPRILDSFQIEYYVEAGATVNGQVFLRLNDGPEVEPGINAPGTVIYTGDVNSLLTGRNYFQDTGLGINLGAATSLTFSVDFTGVDAGEDVGLLYYDPPTIGTSFDDFWRLTESGWELQVTPGIGDNFGAVFTAVPEPSTWALLIGGMSMLGFFGFRRKN
jgi:hypothetical protein